MHLRTLWPTALGSARMVHSSCPISSPQGTCHSQLRTGRWKLLARDWPGQELILINPPDRFSSCSQSPDVPGTSCSPRVSGGESSPAEPGNCPSLIPGTNPSSARVFVPQILSKNGSNSRLTPSPATTINERWPMSSPTAISHGPRPTTGLFDFSSCLLYSISMLCPHRPQRFLAGAIRP
jgi:hypothetical protein